MSMKYMKQINMVMAIAFVLGGMVVASQAQAAYIIPSPGIPENQLYLYPGYVGPIISNPGVAAGPTPTPIIPSLYPTYTPAPTPVVNQQQPVASQPTVVYTQPTVIYQPAPTTQTNTQTTQSSTNQVNSTIFHAPAVNGITSTAKTVDVVANSNVPSVCAGDTVNYTLTYANTTGATISNAVLIVTMPAEVDYTSSTAQANYNDRNRTVTLFVGTLEKGQSGIVYMQGTANRFANGTQTITTRVDFTFVKSNGATATTTNYIIHSGTSCANGLGANVLGAGFLPTSFGGWLILAVLLCAIIFIVRKFFGEKGGHGHAHGGHMKHASH